MAKVHMRRSLTTAEAVEEAQLRRVADRAATMSPRIPSVQLVQKSLDRMGLYEREDSMMEQDEASVDDSVERVVIDLERPASKNAEQDENYNERSDGSTYTEKDSEKSSPSDDEANCTEQTWETGTAETSVDDSQLSEWVHKPLKDLIFKTNKRFYDIDSNKVRYKVGLSRRAAMIPSLHRKKE
ncbi:hypothetical protein HG536_0G03370 [Torulaspora globosa]|uniref:Uncharacterized protein n=1 Tax=Torulaspora globosa TaxID=48254 RepID=A0A7G3ZLT9_9SACH|nr:uncharacterized protein HG536_0G03370 [Torulaspora globosa]QLL34475.1 hypothetical protein HG536_0G03370 [Torulaspora globosa]